MKTQSKRLYIHTIGCQMNVYDSEQMARELAPMGYERIDNAVDADLIIVNTCSVREKAEQKVYSYLGRLAGMKSKRPALAVGVAGCIAQQEGEGIFRRVPEVDFVLGTRAVYRLPGIVERMESGETHLADVDMTQAIGEGFLPIEPKIEQTVTGFVTIMRGCDNYCTYCVVPFVRGREVSRPPGDIIEEIEALTAAGIRDVTLLGQNVNSYGKKEGMPAFHELLLQVNGIADLQRIRFTTSHPKDLSDKLIQSFGSLEKLCHHIHLPAQSGSNRILKRMNRHYTKEQYIRQIEQLRGVCPDIAVTSDIIVGFPGESRADFEQTLDLIKQVEYDSLFMFKYSDRPNTPATHFDRKVSESDKAERFREVLDLQTQQTLKKNMAKVGTAARVLVEGSSKKQNDEARGKEQSAFQWTGRASDNRVVNFSLEYHGDDRTDIKGRMVDVEITKAFPHSLWGCLASPVPGIAD